MSARDQIIGLIGGSDERIRPIAERVADGILAKHAHELAEQIRAEVTPLAVFRSEETRALVKYGRRLADLIDPEVP